MPGLPLVRVLRVEKRQEGFEVKLKILSNISYLNHPIAPAGLHPGRPKEDALAGHGDWAIHEAGQPIELHRLKARKRKKIIFEIFGNATELPVPGKLYEFCSWWDARQLTLAQTSPEEWERQRFTPSDAISFHVEPGRKLQGQSLDEFLGALPPEHRAGRMVRKHEGGPIPEGAELIPGGWSHEHCELCWAPISAYEEDENVGYVNTDEWLCQKCYGRFIKSGLGKLLG